MVLDHLGYLVPQQAVHWAGRADPLPADRADGNRERRTSPLPARSTAHGGAPADGRAEQD